MSIGFIGCGNMATAIIDSIVKFGINPKDIYAYDVNDEALNSAQTNFNINICRSETEVVSKCDSVILAIKPNIIENVLKNIDNALQQNDTLLISIAAGKTLDFLSSCISKENRIIRVMPNINAVVGQAICAYTANEYATDEDKKFAEKLLNMIGKVVYLEEKHFPTFGVLGGCSPAMVYMFIDELARAGVKNGMTKEQSLKIAAQAVYGSAKMVMESDLHPYELVDKVCSPGGTTIEAITSLQEDGFEAAIHNAVDKAIEKDKKL